MLTKAIITVLHLVVTHGFLLEPNTPKASANQTLLSSQTLTLSEFYEYQKRQDQKANALQAQTDQARLDTVNLRQDMDKTMALLASQLQQKLTDFQSSQCQCSGHNQLLDRYTLLEQKFEALLTKYIILEGELSDIKNKTLAAEKYTETLNKGTLEHDNKLNIIKNKTFELQEIILELQQLKTLQQITDIRNLQQTVEFLSSRTHDLSVNEQARNQDFLALHNITMETQYNVQNLEKANTAFMAKIGDYEKVAVTSCSNILTAQLFPVGSIIKFNDVVTNVGFRNISGFQNSGKFISEKPGLYHISVYIGTNANLSFFHIYKNGNYVSRIFDVNNGWHSNTAVVALELHTGDSVWVEISSQMTINYFKSSCIRIVKIK